MVKSSSSLFVQKNCVTTVCPLSTLQLDFKQSKSCSISGCDLKQKHLASLHKPILLYGRSQGEIEIETTFMCVIVFVLFLNSNGNAEAPNGFVGLAGGNTQTRAGCETKA